MATEREIRKRLQYGKPFPHHINSVAHCFFLSSNCHTLSNKVRRIHIFPVMATTGIYITTIVVYHSLFYETRKINMILMAKKFLKMWQYANRASRKIFHGRKENKKESFRIEMDHDARWKANIQWNNYKKVYKLCLPPASKQNNLAKLLEAEETSFLFLVLNDRFVCIFFGCFFFILRFLAIVFHVRSYYCNSSI